MGCFHKKMLCLDCCVSLSVLLAFISVIVLIIIMSNSHTNPPVSDRTDGVLLTQPTRKKVHVNCQDYMDHGYTKSGYYMIDPDGIDIGLEPFRVHCNFETGSTFVYQYRNRIYLSPCANKVNCTFRLNYRKVSKQQIENLKISSKKCSQEIKFRCNRFPLKGLASWVDFHGEEQIYFSGSNYGKHMCSCGESDTCRPHGSVHFDCNCDASNIRKPLIDNGRITNTSAVPIQSIRYNFTAYNSRFGGSVVIGNLECNGKSSGNDPCTQLRLSGNTHSMNHIFENNDVTGDGRLYYQFCNMSRPLGQESQGYRKYVVHHECRNFGDKKCRNGMKCIPIEKFCDGIQDCEDNSDEIFCKKKQNVSEEDEIVDEFYNDFFYP